ncbi:uncharacterized protein LOC124366588 isoform X2 [Homalodisca vitripennis]|uniref:uncharacterized protein LOC124366588 isoform X2 n=1 Tax=Homalodisca vitripennis TaxID=197043 RepID=UPI001EEBF793|nr:uncharacterized protein LOC124366588 isoform X2 [Homalodisca vitripennis]
MNTMKTSLLLFSVVLAVIISLVESRCGTSGCACSNEPNGNCCPGYRCGQHQRCVEPVVERAEFLYPFQYDCGYGYNDCGVPQYGPQFPQIGFPNYGYYGGLAALGNNYVGRGFGGYRTPFVNYL